MQLDVIQAFFVVWDDKISFLKQLFDDARHDEAMTLCCAYIDGFAQALYWPCRHSGFNFVRALREHGGVAHLDLIYPTVFIHWARKREEQDHKWKDLSKKIESAFQAYKDILASEPDLRTALHQALRHNELQLVVRELWRGTLAHAAYQGLRNPFIHGLRGYGGILSDRVTYQGAMVPEINFSMLHQALTFIACHARELSEQSGRLCIHV
jgi:hypothetical protein